MTPAMTDDDDPASASEHPNLRASDEASMMDRLDPSYRS